MSETTKVSCTQHTQVHGETFLEGKEYPAAFDATGFLFAKGEMGQWVKVMTCRKDAVFRQHFRL
jgi:hypothetical protein